jgi:ketosteroid isomerase-like protein
MQDAGSLNFADWLEITSLKARYCRLLDTKDWDGFAALFTEDAVLDVKTATGFGRIEGRAKFMPMVRSSIGTANTAHQVHQPEIAVDGDIAHVTWAMQDRVHWQDGKRSITGYGHYHERYVRTADGWRIAFTQLTRLHVDEHAPPVTP